VLPYREVGISDSGEVLVRGETLFAGYVEGDVIVRPLDDEGWFHTGDIGVLDGEGYLRVRGRKDNMFISGGENIQPEEIEEAISSLEGIKRAVVAPVPDAEFGFRPVVFVFGVSVEPEKLKEFLASLLPRFKVPVAFYEWPEGADPEAAKVDRAFFRERARLLQRA
jgi:O-succinylbenzoic acid--CoA ligase